MGKSIKWGRQLSWKEWERKGEEGFGEAISLPSPIIFPQTLSQPVLNGGPVSDDRGFVLHYPKDNYSSSIEVTEELSVTTSKDILATLGTEDQPYKYLVES